MYTLWKDSPCLVNTSITLCIYLFWVRILKFYPLSKFQLCNMVLSTSHCFTLGPQTLFIFYLKACTLLPTSISLIPQPLATTFLFHFFELDFYFSDSTCKWYHWVFVFLCLASFTYCNALSLFMLLQMAGFPSFSWMNNISLYMYITFSLSAYPLIRHLSCFHILAIVNGAAVKVGVFCSISCFHFLWIYTQKGDCWVIW